MSFKSIASIAETELASFLSTDADMTKQMPRKEERNMLLWDLLEIRMDEIPRRCKDSLIQLNSLYHAQGAPIDLDKLIEILDYGIAQCEESGLNYPKIVLKRLWQMRRGEWTPTEEKLPWPK